MAQFKRHFTIDEARSLLPHLRDRFAEVRTLVAQIREEQKANSAERLRILRGNGKGPLVQSAGPQVAAIQEQIDAIVGMGIQIKDLERGLIDFPHFLGGDATREVLLCYEVSEPDIGFWHEIDSGFDDRHPL